MKGRKPRAAGIRAIEGRRPLGSDPLEALPAVIPEMPDHLDEYGREEWRSLAPGLFRCGLLRAEFATVFSAYCAAAGLHRRCWLELAGHLAQGNGLTHVYPNGKEAEHPLLRVAGRAAQDAVKFAAEIGLTPTAAARLQAHKTPHHEAPILAMCWPNVRGNPDFQPKDGEIRRKRKS